MVSNRNQCWNLYCLWIYRNDLDKNVGGLISKLADDTKIGKAADNAESWSKDIDQLEIREENWQVELNPDSVWCCT